MSEHERGSSRRSEIETCGIPVEKIPNLHTCERVDFSKEETVRAVFKKKETYTHDELFGRQVFFSGFIEVPVDNVFDYISNVYSLEEWTCTLRNFVYMGGDMYKAF